jgi:hypothetical protein
MSDPIHIISLGAGAQSSTMALMAAKGEITPMPVAAIFADTQDEPASVYSWLEWLSKRLPFPVIRVGRKESLRKRCLGHTLKDGRVTITGIPAHILNTDGTISMMPRQCTRDFKIDPISKAVNQCRQEAAAIASPTSCYLWIGISTCEVSRAKTHRNSPKVENRFPLFEANMSRQDCLAWMERKGFPRPPRSACYYCPYHSNAEWRRLKDDEPAEFSKAVAFERDFQAACTRNSKLLGVPFLHRSCKPLSEVDFSTEEERGQLNMFNNECEGMCGV